MSKTTSSVLATAMVGALMTAGSAAEAEVDVSANVALVSDYAFRGVSQTSRDPAIQGGFDVAWDSGFYVGTWSSNVSFGTTSQELDLYAGYSGDINESLSFDVNYTRFEYPSDGAALDYNEFGGSLSYGNATMGLIYSDEYFALDDVEWVYPYADYSLPLGTGALDFHVGLSVVDDNAADDWVAGFGDEEVLDWSVFYTMPVSDVDLGVGVVGTDIDDDVCDAECDTRAIVSLSKSL